MAGAAGDGAIDVAVWPAGGAVSPAGLGVMEIRLPDGFVVGSASFILALVMGGTLGQYHVSEDMLLELVNEAEAIPTNAWRCVLASWPA